MLAPPLNIQYIIALNNIEGIRTIRRIVRPNLRVPPIGCTYSGSLGRGLRTSLPVCLHLFRSDVLRFAGTE